jgi:LPXTG-site transpeptidase (sortase) family protein
VSAPSRRKQEAVVPLSLVFVVMGGICLLTAVAIWAWMPVQIPERLELALVPVWTPTAVAPVSSDNPSILLPETPLESASSPHRLPSEATLADAPRDLLVGGPLPGQPARLQISRLKLDAPITQVYLERVTIQETAYYQWEVPAAYMAGWHNNSALLGQPGNTVLNGHHNIYGQLFRDLADLEVGDEIVVHDAQRPFAYQVEQIFILPERGEPIATRLANAQWIEPTDDERLTLISCWPFHDNSHRLIVVARPTAVDQISDSQ